MREEPGQHPVALRLVQLVDADGIARVAVEHRLAGDGVGQEDGMHGGGRRRRCSSDSGPRWLPGRCRMFSQNLLKSWVAVASRGDP